MSDITTPWKALDVKLDPTTRDQQWVVIHTKGVAFDISFPPCVTAEEARQVGLKCAAAPDLLAALEEVIRWVPGQKSWHTDGAAKAVERARAAIKKAKGEA